MTVLSAFQAVAYILFILVVYIIGFIAGRSDKDDELWRLERREIQLENQLHQLTDRDAKGRFTKREG
jgi:hypothetical protein